MGYRRILRDVVVATAVIAGAWTIHDRLRCRPNRVSIIGVMGDLRLGMTRDDVAQVILRHDALRLERPSTPQGLLLAGPTGVAAWWQLGIVFQDGKLISARVWTEDGPQHPAGVPPDIG
jgi:hypothetical protein